MAATMIAKTSSFMGVKPVQAKQPKAAASRGAVVVRAGAYDEELMATAVRPYPCAAAERWMAPCCGVETQGTRQSTWLRHLPMLGPAEEGGQPGARHPGHG